MKSVAKLSAVALIASLALVGCSVEAGAPVPAKPAAQVASSAAAEAPAPTTEPPAAIKDKIAKFGESFEYLDGLTVTVTGAGAGIASDTAAGAEVTEGQMYLFTVEVMNGSEEIFDPAMFRAEVNYGPEGTAASMVFDSAQNIGDRFQGRILPGKKQTVTYAFAIPADKLGEVLMIVSPSYEHAEKLFSSPLS